jgi:hypothetical protein
MIDGGYVRLYRKLKDSWQGMKPLWWFAWTWLMCEARFKDCPEKGLSRGQLWFSIGMGQKQWGMSRMQTRRFLTRCVTEGDILWEKGAGGRSRINCVSGTQSDPQSDPQSDTVLSRITIVKYDIYNPQSDPQSDRVCDPLLKKEKKEEEEPPIVPQGGRGCAVSKNSKKLASKDAAFLQEQLSAINIANFVRTYEPQGLDVLKCFDSFCEYVLTGNAKKPIPNPANWVDFSRAFHDSCKSALSKGMYQITSNPGSSGKDQYAIYREAGE